MKARYLRYSFGVLLRSTSIVFLASIALIPIRVARAAPPQVLRVGTYKGIPGDFSNIQTAVDAAQPGDFILIAPGDWHPQGDGDLAGIYVTTPDLTIVGMDRNTTVIDGTLPGSKGVCASDKASQNFGPLDKNGKPEGRNGILITRTASGVNILNLTVCNFLTGSMGGGNQVYFDGDPSHTAIKLHAWWANYVSATTTYYDLKHHGEYGLFASHTDGGGPALFKTDPSSFDYDYASNMADSGIYIGACPNCNAIIDHSHAQYNSLGYSGTNSGGNLIIENSEWDHNSEGLDTNTQSVGDPPPPQNGACPSGDAGPTGTGSCWILRNNYIHDNNQTDVARDGLSAEAPVGTGVSISGGRNDIIENNFIANNGAWGVLITLFPDTAEPVGGTPAPPAGQPKQPNCSDGLNIPTLYCLFNPTGNEVTSNVFSNDGFFGNLTNGDLAELSDPSSNGNCWHFNRDLSGTLTSAPLLLETTHAVCGQPNTGAPLTSVLGIQAICDTGALLPCPANAVADYPKAKPVVLRALPPQPTMPDPCAGVPGNPWCAAAGKTSSQPGAPPSGGDSAIGKSTGSGSMGLLDVLGLLGLTALRRRWRCSCRDSRSRRFGR